MFYLASPYSDADRSVRQDRFEAACRATAALMRAGRPILSPIVHSHPLVDYGLPTDWEYWQHVDRRLLAMCDEVIVLTLPGWQQSRGVQAEIAIARELGLPVTFLAPAEETPGESRACEEGIEV